MRKGDPHVRGIWLNKNPEFVKFELKYKHE